jgi:hypothetical protein
MAGEFKVTVRGVEDAARELRALAPKLRKRAIMNSLRAGARVVRGEVKRLVPVLRVPVYRKGRLIRKPGTVRDAVAVRTSRASARVWNLGVFVNVRPAKGANRGTFNPFDPFYWRFLVGAGGRMAAALRAGGAKLPAALAKIEATLGPAIQKLNRKGAQP